MSLERATLAWWESKRPFAYTEAQHLANPTINCTSEVETALALEVAAALQPQKTFRRRVDVSHGKLLFERQESDPKNVNARQAFESWLRLNAAALIEAATFKGKVVELFTDFRF